MGHWRGQAECLLASTHLPHGLFCAIHFGFSAFGVTCLQLLLLLLAYNDSYVGFFLLTFARYVGCSTKSYVDQSLDKHTYVQGHSHKFFKTRNLCLTYVFPF